MKKLVLFALFAVVPSFVFAKLYDTFSVANEDGIYISYWFYQDYQGVKSVAVRSSSKTNNQFNPAISKTTQGTLRIPSSVLYLGDTYVVDDIGTNAFIDCSGITTVILGESITSIGNNAFNGCSGLTNITIPDNVNSIGNGAFTNCINLTSIELPSGLSFIGSTAFKNCTGLTTIRLPLEVGFLGDSPFVGCSARLSIHFINMYSFNVWMDYFCNSGCPIPSSEWFVNNIQIKEVSIQEGTVNVCDNAFKSCGGLERIIIPESVQSIGNNAFYGCWNLKYVEMPSNLQCIGDLAFYNTGITILTLPDELSSIGSGAFASCNSLLKIFCPSSLTNISNNAFEGCGNLIDVTLSEGIETIGSRAFKDCSKLDSIIIPNSITSIGENAFYFCEALEYVSLGEGLNELGEQAFISCGIKAITLPRNITSIGNAAFARCSNLFTVISNIKNFIGIPSGVFSRIPSDAVLFTPYSQLDSYRNTYEWKSSFSEIRESAPQTGDYFSLAMPLGTDELNIKVKVTNTDPFYLVEMVADGFTAIPSETTGDLIIPSSIVNVDGKKFYIKGIGSEALKGTNITSISIPEGVEYIEEDAISQCSELSTIYLPRSLTSIGNIFSGCNNLTSFYFSKRKPDEVAISNDIRDNISEQAVLYVPAGTKENYANHAIWGKCLQIIEKGPISAGDISAKYGTLAELPIILNEPTTIMGLQFKLTLPKGVSVVDNNGTLVASLTDRTSNMIIMGRKDPDAVNSYLFIILSLEGKAISGNEGNIATIRLSISNDIDVKKHDIFIEDAFLTSNTFSTISSECISEITIKDMILGDVNNDNDIDIADVIGVVNYILKNPSETFILGSADINMDGDIDIADVIGVVNIILRNTSSPSQLSSLRQLPSNVIFNMLDPE